MTQPHPQGVLEAGYELLWYRIGRVIGRGAFGITYLAEDINLHRPVAIKEFFPSQHCTRVGATEIKPLSEESADDFRWAMERFLTEARTLAQFEHPNIIRVLNVFERNGTAYMVMNYESGVSLSALLKRRRTLNEREISKITLPVLDGLEKVHATGFIHRDIKPSNIYIREGGSPVLLDFGSARQSMQEYTQTLTSLVSPGYAPIEQYTSRGDRQGPWTDIYGLGATLYRAVTGLVPPSAVDRSEALSEGKEDYMTHARDLVREPYGDDFLKAIDHALAFRVEDRPQNIADWRAEFGFDNSEIDTQPEYYGAAQQADTGNWANLKSNTGTRTEPNAPGGTNPANAANSGSAAPLAADNFINLAGSESETAVNTAIPVRHSDTGRALAPLLSGVQPLMRRRYYLAAAIAALLVIASGALLNRLTSQPASVAAPVEDIQYLAKLPEPPAGENPVPITPSPDQAQRIDSLLENARADMAADRLTLPENRNAFDKFRQVLALDRDNPTARRGIEAIFNRYMQMAQTATRSGEFDKASNLLQRASTVMPEGPGLMRARVQLEQHRTEARMESLSEAVDGTTDSVAPATAEPAAEPSSEDSYRRRLGGETR